MAKFATSVPCWRVRYFVCKTTFKFYSHNCFQSREGQAYSVIKIIMKVTAVVIHFYNGVSLFKYLLLG